MFDQLCLWKSVVQWNDGPLLPSFLTDSVLLFLSRRTCHYFYDYGPLVDKNAFYDDDDEQQ